jgi:hypothetical protein
MKKMHRGLTEDQLIRARCKDSPTGAHHWLIETPEGQAAQGSCKYCGEDREFPAGQKFVRHWEGEKKPTGKTYVEGLRGSKC